MVYSGPLSVLPVEVKINKKLLLITIGACIVVAQDG